MIVGKKNIIAWYEEQGNNTQNGVPYWSLFYKGQVEKGNAISRSKIEDNATMAEALESLRRTLDLLSRGQYTLIANDDPSTTKRGGLRADFEIPASDGETVHQAAPMGAISGMPQTIGDLEAYTDRKTAAAIAQAKTEMKLEQLQRENEDLKKENKDLEKQVGNGSNRLWEAINGIGIGNIIAAFTKSPNMASVTGIPATAMPPENDAEMTHRLESALAIFMQNDPDWLDTLERMAARIQKDPSIIKMFKSFL